MDGRTARANFEYFLGSLRDQIEEDFRRPGISVRQKIKIQHADTRGWCSRLLFVPNESMRLECWYDQFINQGEYSLWVGLRATPDAMKAHFERLPVDVRVETLIDSDKVKTDSSGQHYYVGNLPKNRFKRLCAEDYENGDMFAGRYFFDLRDLRRPNLPREVMSSLAVLMAGLRSTDDDPHAYTHVKTREGREIVVRHIKRERDGKAPREAKKRDGYQCKVCDMQFTDWYGPYGKKFAEAHHVLPFASRFGEHYITEKNLITVCSNCHRMLHKMDGKRGDWKKLKSIVDQHRKTQ